MRPAMKTIVLATCAARRDLHPEDRALAACLRDKFGQHVEVRVWSEPHRWDAARDMVVIRSVWDYQQRLGEFLSWLDELERGGVAVWNPVPVLRWNSDKRYLREMAERGVAIPRTEWIEAANAYELRAAWLRLDGLCVLKPSVSASGQDTFLVRDEAGLVRASEALAGRSVMAQEYLDAVRGEGEWSLVYFGGEFSHAFRKRATGDEFRVQEEHGGVNTPADAPPPAALATAHQALAVTPSRQLAYARVDGVMRGNEFVLMELELLEPRLYPEMGVGATERFARHLATLAGG
jgi:glutathione synthase/RimK-type ligase-like ATP-grasp enzyme